MGKAKYKTREEWLVAAVDMLRPSFEKHSGKIPEKVKVSIGFPPKGGMAKRRTLGVCFIPEASADGNPQIYINPTIDQIGGEDGILSVLVHELVHACGRRGHGREFKELAVAVGLEGRMASSTASVQLQDYFMHMMEILGSFPHSNILNVSSAIGQKPDKCRMHKCECEDCGYTVRIANKWIDMGVPNCPMCDIELKKK